MKIISLFRQLVHQCISISFKTHLELTLNTQSVRITLPGNILSNYQQYTFILYCNLTSTITWTSIKKRHITLLYFILLDYIIFSSQPIDTLLYEQLRTRQIKVNVLHSLFPPKFGTRLIISCVFCVLELSSHATLIKEKLEVDLRYSEHLQKAQDKEEH